MRGTQKPDGTIDERHVVVHELHADNPITAAQARQVARALIAAADEVDALVVQR
jgi:truncated hemoglobin YjbI